MIPVRVTKAAVSGRTISVTDGSRSWDNIFVPVNLPVPSIGSSVLICEDSLTVLSISELGDYEGEEHPDRTFMEYFPGDNVTSIPNQGMFGVLSKFRAVLAAKTTGILIDGLLKQVLIRTNNLLIQGKHARLSIESPDDPLGLPVFRFNLGGESSFNLNISVAESSMEMQIFGILFVEVSVSKAHVHLVNPYTKQKIVLLDENFSADRDQAEEEGSITKVYSFTRDLMINAANITVKGTNLEASFSRVDLIAAKVATMVAPSIILRANSKINAEAPNMQFDVGNSGAPGGFHVNNGIYSHIRMRTVLGLFGLAGIEINGSDDVMVGYRSLAMILNIILAYLTALNSAIAAIPPLTPVASALGGTLLTAQTLTAVDLPIWHIRCGSTLPVKPMAGGL